MKIIGWIKNNLMIVVLIILVLLLVIIKLSTGRQDEVLQNNKNVLPTPTITNIVKLYNNKTKEEILQMETEERDSFVSELSREEIEELDMTPDYDFSDFLPYINPDFVVEKYDKKNKTITVKPLMEDKEKLKQRVDSWLFYETGNNPRNIKIIWQ